MKTIRTIRKSYRPATVLVIVVFQLVFPQLAAPANAETDSVLVPNLIITEGPQTTATQQSIGLIFPFRETTPEPEPQPQYIVKNSYTITVTAYSSTADQTDSTPCITANGYNLCEANQENVIAANFLPFGTQVRIPEYFGDRIFTVQDRMNARYYYRADVWFKTRQDAIVFGAPYTVVEVVEEI
jgi:3D (Asp-Asp-Asp) domain-containing protein